MFETVAKLKVIYEIGEYVTKNKLTKKQLLSYLDFLKTGYEARLVQEATSFYEFWFEVNNTDKKNIN